jgi:polar amino acid transport system permease protein
VNWDNWLIAYNNFDYFLWGAYPEGPLGGLAMSIFLALAGIFGAFWLGLAAGLMRLSSKPWVKLPSVVYIEVIRGVPLLMLIFWFYFLAPILLGHTLPEFQSALVAFIVFTSAYIGEIVRAGVKALPKGQMEAARGSGLSHVQAMRHVILPQALRNMIPSFVNQFVSLTKDTSLAYIIGVNELTRAATQVNNRTMNSPTEIFITIAVLYFIICYVLTSVSRRMEKHLSRYQARGG